MAIRKASTTTSINKGISAAVATTVNDAVRAVGGSGPVITNVIVTDSSYTNTDDTALTTAGGYLKLIGTGFASGCTVYVGAAAASSTTFVSSTEVRVVVGANSLSTLNLYLVNTDGSASFYLSGLLISGVPSWSTGATLTGAYEQVAYSQTLTATGDATISYSLKAGSTLPAGVSLDPATGILSGTTPVVASGSTTYTFTIIASDGQNQDTERLFSLTINHDVVTWSTPAADTAYSVTSGDPIAAVTLSASSASGKSITYTADTLPTGLSIVSNSITGTPTVAGSTATTLTATAANTSATATRSISWTISVAIVGDPYAGLVSLYLNGDGTNGANNNTFIDSSTNGFSVTRAGNATQGPFSPFSPTGWSAYYDGTGDYVTTSGFGLPTNFTVEFWTYFTAQPTGGYLMSASTSGPIIAVEGAKTIVGWNGGWILNPPNDSSVYPNGVAPLNQWNHWAVVRSGSVMTFYLNGIMLGTNGSVTNDATASQTWGIGSANDGSPVNVPFYMSNFRMSSVARYSGTNTTLANFSLPTADFTSDASTVFLTHQSSRFKDSGPNNRTVVKYGDTKLFAFSPFNPTVEYSAATHGGSMVFDGTGDYLQLAQSSQWQFTGNFTIEFWMYANAISGEPALVSIGTTDPNSSLVRLSSDKLQFWINGSTSGIITCSTTIQIGQWYHVAWVRSGSSATNVKIYLNGVQDGVTSSAKTATLVAAPLLVARYGSTQDSGSFNGYISNLRVNNTALYTSTFTPPTAPLTAVSGTVALLKGIDAGVVDNTGRNNIETIGTARVSTAASKYGTGSILFSGAGAALFTRTNPALAFESGNFTVEFWVRFTSIANRQDLIWWVPDNDSLRGGISWRLSGDALIYYDASVGGAINTAWLPTVDTWYHIALSRSGSSTRLFIDGVAGTTYSTIRPYVASYRVYIGKDSASDTYPFTGYMDDIRITKGVARYTSNFTPPTASFSVIAPATKTMQYLAVGAGGGGGHYYGGGGGGGGVQADTVSAVTGVTYTVTVGAGGAGGPSAGAAGSNGNASSITGGGFGIQAIGGQGGGGINATPPGGSIAMTGGKSGAPQSYAGGASTVNVGGVYRSGGGGGAGAVGVTGASGVNPDGGAGYASSITGTSTQYGGGGGGGAGSTTTNWGRGAPWTLNIGGGGGGGGDGHPSPDIYGYGGAPGIENLGGGGGGGYTSGGGAGGKGVVIIKVADSLTVSTTGSPSLVTSGGYKVYTFNSTGTIILA